MGLQAPLHLLKKTTIRNCHARQPLSSTTPVSGTKQHSTDLLCSYSKHYHSPPCLWHLINRRESNYCSKSHSTLRTVTLICSFTSAAYLPHMPDASTCSLKPPIAPLKEKLEFYSISYSKITAATAKNNSYLCSLTRVTPEIARVLTSCTAHCVSA